MSTSHRLHWLIAEIHKGRDAMVTFSYNTSNHREKIKFILTDAYASTGVYRPCVMSALMSLQAAIVAGISTDRGHKSSDGRTIVEFWIQQPTSHFDDSIPGFPSVPDPAPHAPLVVGSGQVGQQTEPIDGAELVESIVPFEDHASDAALAWYHTHLDETFASLGAHRQSLLNAQEELGKSSREQNSGADHSDTLRGLVSSMREYIRNHNQMVTEAIEPFRKFADKFLAQGLTCRCPAEVLGSMHIEDRILDGGT